MARSTYKTYLMSKTLETWSKLIDIKEYPDLGGEPEMLETTTLSDPMQTFVPGVQSLSALSFLANYDSTKYDELKELSGQQKEYAVWFGGTGDGASATPTGSEGKFKFTGDLSVYCVGGGVNAVTDMRIVIAPSTPITRDTEMA